MPDAPPLPDLLRSRKLSRQRPLRLRLGNPTRRPLRTAALASVWAESARPRSTAASSNTCAETACRHPRPVTCLMMVPSGATTNSRPASSVFFQALNALIRSNPDHGTLTCGSFPLVARGLGDHPKALVVGEP